MAFTFFLAFIALGLLASLIWPWWLPDKKGLIVLVYHKIGHPPPGSRLKDLWVSPENFERQIEYLVKKGYSTVLFSDLEKNGNDPGFAEKSVLITFDDGYENNYRNAFPVLKKYNAKGNLFLVFNTIGKSNEWHAPESEPWQKMADAGMIKEMAESGLVEFGAHTMNHPRLSRLDPEMAEWEISESKRQIETLLSRQITAFAYPYGDGAYNPSLRQMVFNAGFRWDFSFRQGKTPWPWDRKTPIDRLFIKGKDTMPDFILRLKKGKNRII